MGSSEHPNVNKLLKYYDKCREHMDQYKPMMRKFLETLQFNYNTKQNLAIKVKHFYRVGSTYDNSVVHPDTDFDIGMVLSGPYNMDCFKVTKTEHPGIYILKCVSGSYYFSNFLSYDNFFKAEELKNKVSDDLISVLRSMKSFNDFKIQAKPSFSGVDVEFHKDGQQTLKMDIIPQIEGNINHDVPDWNGEYHHNFIKKIINENRFQVFFTLTPPPTLRDHKLSKLMVQAAFTILEVELTKRASTTVYDALRISKGLLYNNMTLKKGGLRSFQILRVAMKHFDEIDRMEDSWEGYRFLIQMYIEMLLNGGVEGYLIKDQKCLWRNEEQCEELGRKLSEVFHSITPANVLQYLVTNSKFYANCT